MVEDLKRQASELYKEHTETEELPTSDSLSIKKLVYVSLGLLLLLAVIISALGGFKQRPNPIVAANMPATIPKESPPPELLEPADTKPTSAVASLGESKAEVASPATGGTSEKQREAKITPAASIKSEEKPVGAKSRPTREIKSSPAPEKPRGVGADVPDATANVPALPEVSPLEIARQELARDIVLEKSPALAKLISSPSGSEYKGWKAEAEGSDTYQVTFTFLDSASGSTAQYVWRVHMTSRTITPLSYYARKLL